MLSSLKIPKELRRKIDNELQPGEVIKWVEQPIPRVFSGISLGIVLVGILWTSFVLSSMWTALGFEEGVQPDYQFAPYGVIGLVIGFGMLYSPISVWQIARKTVYVVTNKRAISILDGSSTTIKSYLPDQLRELYRRERADGTGDVITEIRQSKDSYWNQIAHEVVFQEVRNPREVENILRRLVQNHS